MGSVQHKIQNPAGYYISAHQFVTKVMELSCTQPASFSHLYFILEMHLAANILSVSTYCPPHVRTLNQF